MTTFDMPKLMEVSKHDDGTKLHVTKNLKWT